MEQTLKKILFTLLLVLLAVFSFLFLGDRAAAPETHAATVAVIDSKTEDVLKLTASASLASIGVSSGGFGYIEVSFDQNAARNAAREYFTANGSRQPWLIFHFSCTGVRQDGVRVSDEFDLYQAPV